MNYKHFVELQDFYCGNYFMLEPFHCFQQIIHARHKLQELIIVYLV